MAKQLLFNESAGGGGGDGTTVSGSVNVQGTIPYRIELGFRATRVSLKAPTTTSGQFSYIWYDAESVLGESTQLTANAYPTTGSTGTCATRDFPSTDTNALRLQDIDDTGITICYNRTNAIEYTAS